MPWPASSVVIPPITLWVINRRLTDLSIYDNLRGRCKTPGDEATNSTLDPVKHSMARYVNMYE